MTERRDIMKRIASLLLVAVLITTFTTAGYAQTPQAKLGRGLANTLTGLLEVPLQTIRTCEADGAPKGLTIGLARGVVLGIYRTLVGIYEVVTFPIPAPADYRPITEPPTLLTSETLVPEDPSMRSDFRPLGSQLEGGSTSTRSRGTTTK
jgi:putative exosortase-associated protein (TIGR04073 family)